MSLGSNFQLNIVDKLLLLLLLLWGEIRLTIAMHRATPRYCAGGLSTSHFRETASPPTRHVFAEILKYFPFGCLFGPTDARAALFCCLVKPQ